MRTLTRTAGMLILFAVMVTMTAAKMVGGKTATVKDHNGILIYYYSTPNEEYTKLGEYNMKAIMSCKPLDWVEKLTDQSKKRFPDVEAIIIYDNFESCQAIKFK